MRLIDADKLYPDRMTNKGTVAISQSQIAKAPTVQAVGWNNHQVACLLADLFGDTCACNYNGIDEWLPEVCDFKDTCCPNPVGVACWEQFLKHYQDIKEIDK